MTKSLLTTMSALMLLVALPVAAHARATSGVKSASECKEEYKANKPAIQSARELKRNFIEACRALPPGTITPIGNAAASPAPAPLPTASPAPVGAPAPRATQAAAPGESACSNSYAHLPADHTAVQFCEEAQAKAHCPGRPVVWLNTKSKIFHVAGANTYGHTKEGAYICEADATAEGDRLSKNGH